MVLNIVKNDLPASCIAEYVRCVFDNAKVNINDENAVSVDIEVTGKNKEEINEIIQNAIEL